MGLDLNADLGHGLASASYGILTSLGLVAEATGVAVGDQAAAIAGVTTAIAGGILILYRGMSRVRADDARRDRVRRKGQLKLMARLVRREVGTLSARLDAIETDLGSAPCEYCGHPRHEPYVRSQGPRGRGKAKPSGRGGAGRPAAGQVRKHPVGEQDAEPEGGPEVLA